MRARSNQSLVACKVTTAHRARDSHELLVNNPTSADVLMSNLTVAHHWLSILDGQPDILTRRLDQRVRPLPLQPIAHRRLAKPGSVRRALLGVRVDPPAITDDQDARAIAGRCDGVFGAHLLSGYECHERPPAATQHNPRVSQATPSTPPGLRRQLSDSPFPRARILYA